jgi:hypothetical protein
LPEFERLLTQQVRRCLVRRRQRSVADNLIERSQQILGELPFEEIHGLSPTRYRLAGFATETRDPFATELRAAAIVARAVPRDTSRVARERAPRIYTNRALAALLEGVARTLTMSFTLRDLDEIFRLVLTDLIPSHLEAFEAIEDGAQPATAEDPAVTAVVHSVVEHLTRRLTKDQRMILRMKAADVADSELAAMVGISRPTLAARKHEIFEIIRSETTDLDAEQREQAVSLTLLELARGRTE